MTDGAHLYIVRCADGSFYTGTARDGLERRIDEYNNGMFHGFTATRRPVMLVYSQWFARITDAIAAERRVKGWSRAKKEALIQGNFDKLSDLARRRRPHPSRRPPRKSAIADLRKNYYRSRVDPRSVAGSSG